MVASNSRWFYLLDVLAAAGVGLMIIRSATWGRRKTIGTVKDNVIAPEGASHTLEDREESDSISGSFDAAPSQDESPELTAPPKLSREDSKALSDLMQLVNTGGLEKRLHPYIAVAAESFESYCLRFLRARKSNPKLAFDMLEADLKWRESVGVNEVASLEAHEVLGCQISAIWPYTPQWLQGHDRAGRVRRHQNMSPLSPLAPTRNTSIHPVLCDLFVSFLYLFLRLIHSRSSTRAGGVSILTRSKSKRPCPKWCATICG